MMLITARVSVLTNSDPDLYISKEDLDYLLKDDAARKEFLDNLERPFIEVSPIINYSVDGNQIIIKDSRTPEIKNTSLESGGCSHAISF